MKITIAKMGGEIEISSPSLATCFEFVSLWDIRVGQCTASETMRGIDRSMY